MSRNKEVEFVITTPPELGSDVAFLNRARTTLGAFTQVIATSVERVVISAPFIQASEGLNAVPLSNAVAAALQRGVQLEIASTLQGLRSIDLGKLDRKHHSNLYLYVARSSLETDRRLGSHAKFCVNDRSLVYLGSANLTGPGLGQHLEMGVLLSGAIADQVMSFWDMLVAREFFIEYEGDG